ncbi:MAG: ThuA domain-containing protein [Opitutus sp.]
MKLVLPLLLSFAASIFAAPQLRVLIVDGQNNHDAWPKSTMMMKAAFEETGRFRVDVARTAFTWKGEKWLSTYPLRTQPATQDLPEPKPDPTFAPDFSAYDVVVSNFGWKAAAWPGATQRALEKFVHAGGGLVVVHSADNSFPEWHEFNRMIGVGGWGGRDEKSGPFLYFDTDGRLVRDESPGPAGSHGPQHEFQITARVPDHPILRGLPTVWLHTKDECYQQLRGPAEALTVLATAYAVPDFKGSGRHEPALMVIDYGKGRVFHTTLGHDDYSLACIGFIATFTRGTEWAATGQVTLPVPADFPTATTTRSRIFP